MTIILYGTAGELDRCYSLSAKTSAILAAIEKADWILSDGDTIAIVKTRR